MNLSDLKPENLKNLPLETLMELRKALTPAIEAAEVKIKQDVFDLWRDAAESAGFKMEALIAEYWKENIAPKKTDANGQVKRKYNATKAPEFLYVNPNDPNLVWGGRGMKPRWLSSLLDAGIDLESLRTKRKEQ